jgi:hypothetical protein
MSDKKKQPVLRVTCYPVVGAIWRNENDKGEAFYSATFERKYKDKEGRYKNGASFSASDLLHLAKVADLVHTEIMARQELDRGGAIEE